MSGGPLLPYGAQLIEDDDIASVVEALRGVMLTTGPTVEKFESALAQEVGAAHAVVCSSGTAALYLAARALGIAAGDYVIVPAVTFLASASAFALAGAEIGFCDVDADSGVMSAAHFEGTRARLIAAGVRAERIKAVVPVHLAGRVEGLAEIRCAADRAGAIVVEDACHALGGEYGDGAYRAGGCAHSLAACFSFHPVKTIAMGEGGAVTTNSAEFAAHARRLRSHGMERDASSFRRPELARDSRGEPNPWYYELPEISHNFRASDINCALGLSQLKKLTRFRSSRRRLFAAYQRLLAPLAPAIRLAPPAPGSDPCWHLCAALIDFDGLGVERAEMMRRLKERGVGTQVHYIPVPWQPYYRDRYGELDLPGAAAYYRRTLSLPLFPGMEDSDVARVVDALRASAGL